MAARATSGPGERSHRRGVGVEATPPSQPNQDLRRRAPFQPLLQPHGIVAGVEDEQRDGSSFGRRRAEEQSYHLLGGGHVVGVPRGMEALHVHRGGPALASEAYLGDELLVGPPGDDDRLAGRVARGVVVEAALWAALGVAPGPHANVHHGVDGRFPFGGGERMASEQLPQGLFVDPSPVEGRVEATPHPRRCDGRRLR